MTEYKEVGTLAEIGAQVGDVLELMEPDTFRGEGALYEIKSGPSGLRYAQHNDGGIVKWGATWVFRIISRKNIDAFIDYDVPRVTHPSAHTANSPTPNKYQRTIKGVAVDIYDIIDAYDIRCPATQHAIKKLFMPGIRGGKDKATDLAEARDSLNRAIELNEARG